MKYTAIAVLCLVFNPLVAAGTDSLTVLRAHKTITLSGYTRHDKSAEVSTEIPGKVVRVNYEVGETIGTEPFIEIDQTFINFQIENTEKSITRSEISLKRLRARVTYLEKEFRRIDALFRDDLVTEVMRDAAEQDLVQARLELDSTVQERNILATTLNELRERRDRHNIFAPSGWVLTQRMVEVGEVVQPGVTLARVSYYGTLVVPLSVSGEELAAVKALPEEFDAEVEGVPVEASLNWINPEFDEKTRKLMIEIAVRDYPGENRGGLRFHLPLRIRTGGVLVPKTAVTRRYENPTVTLKQTGETVQLLVTGESLEHFFAVEDSRLKPGTELLPAGE